MELGSSCYNNSLFNEWGGINVTSPVTDEGKVTGVIHTLLEPLEDGTNPEVPARFAFDRNGSPIVYGE